MRASMFLVLALCSAGQTAELEPWTFVFVVDANTPAPTETRVALDAVAAQVVDVARRAPQHRFAILHAPSDGGPLRLTLVREGKAHVEAAVREREILSILRRAYPTGRAGRAAFVFVGHSPRLLSGGPNTAGNALEDALAPLRAIVEAGGEPVDLVVLHCCHGARIELLAELSPWTRLVVASSDFMQPQDIDYSVLADAEAGRSAEALAERLIESVPLDRRAFAVMRADTERFGAFLHEFDAFSALLKTAVEIGELSPSEFGDLFRPASAELRGHVRLLPLLSYAARAHWLPKEARRHAAAAAHALRPLLPVGADRVMLEFPWRAYWPEERWRQFEQSRFAKQCSWPAAVAAARDMAALPDPLFLGWELERELVSRVWSPAFRRSALTRGIAPRRDAQ